MMDNSAERNLMLEVRKNVDYTLTNVKYLESLVGDKLDFEPLKHLVNYAHALTYTDNFKDLNEALRKVAQEYNDLAAKADQIIYRNIYDSLPSCEDKSHAGFKTWLEAMEAEFLEGRKEDYFSGVDLTTAFNTFLREKYSNAFNELFG